VKIIWIRISTLYWANN